MGQQQRASTPLAENWENEGGSLDAGTYAESLGVIVTYTKSYAVGPYRYSSLADAVAQGRRMQHPGETS